MAAEEITHAACIAAGCEEGSLLGAVGECVQVDNSSNWQCVCPEGYSGNDDWQVYQDCHVNENVQYALWVTTFAISGVMLAVSAFALVHLLLFWEYIPKLQRSVSSASGLTNYSESENIEIVTTDPTTTTDTGSRESIDRKLNLPTPSQQAKARQHCERSKERQYFTLISLSFIICFSVTCLIYYGFYLKGFYRFEVIFLQDLCGALACSSIFCCAWFFFFVWYDNLPSFQQHAKLFGINSILIKKPLLVRRMVQARMALINIVNIVLVVIVPHVFDTSIEERATLDTAALAFWAFIALDFNVTLFSITLILKNLFNQLKSFAERSGSSSDLDKQQIERVDEALYTIRLLRKATMVLGPLNTTMFAISAFVPAVRTRTYLSVNLTIICGALWGLLFTFMFVMRLRGKKECKKQQGAAVAVSSGL